MGSYGIMQIIIRFPLGIIADKYNISGKGLVACGFLASIISAMLLALTDSFMPIYIGRLFAGITAAMWVVLTIWYSTEFYENRSLKAMGLLQTTTVSSQLISMAISGYLADLFGFKSLFWIGGSFAVLGLILVILLPGAQEGGKRKLKDERETPVVLLVLKERKLWLLSLLSLLSHAVLFATIFGFSSVYFNGLNGHTSAIILLVIAFMLPHALASFLLTLKKNSFINPFLVLSICFGIGAGSLILVGTATHWVAYCFLHAILGFSLGVVFPVLLDQVYLTNGTTAAKTVMGFYQSLYSIGIVLGPMAAGYVARQLDVGAVFAMSSVFLMGACIVSIGESMKSKKKNQAYQGIWNKERIKTTGK